MNEETRESLRREMGKRFAHLSPAKRTLLQQRLKEKRRQTLPTQSIPRLAAERSPLSFSQQRLWFLYQYEPNGSVYNISSALRLKGTLNVGALEESLREIVRRHETLRTTFSMLEGEPIQVIGLKMHMTLPLLDLTGGEAAKEAEILDFVSEEAQRPFDLTKGPLFRSILIRLSEKDHVLQLTLHHIVSDGWSMGVLSHELSVLYQAFSQSQASPLAALPIQYADYAVWQRDWLTGTQLEKQLTYWEKQLQGAPTLLNLPTDYPRPAVQSYRGARQTIELSKDLTRGIKALSQKSDATLFMTLLAAFQVLLYRYTGQDDVVVGSPIANRQRSEVEGLIGFFVNTLVLRTDLSGNPSFIELLDRVRKTALEAYEHQDLPFEKLVEELNPERSFSHSPLFQAMFVLQNAGSGTWQLEGLNLSPIRTRTETAKFDLTLLLQERREELVGALQYSTDLFSPETINRLLAHFQILLQNIVNDPNQTISAVPILSVSEKHQLLIEWNDTEKVYPRDRCVHQWFEEQVENSPDAVAVVFENKQLTYRDLNARANQLAHHLQKRGVGPDRPVGVCIERSVAMLVALLAIMKSGGAYVPLDPDYPEARLAWMIEDSGVSTIVAGQKFAGRFPERYTVVCLDDECANLTQESPANPIVNLKPDNLAYIIYTSGSTGTPKGVMIEHQSVVNYLHWFNHTELSEHFHTLPVVANFTFDASVKQLFAPLLRGRHVWMLPNEAMSEPSVLIKALSMRTATGLNCVPTLWNVLLHSIESKYMPPLPSDALSVLLLGGEELNRALIERTLAAFPQVVIWNLYGPTEATANAIAGRITGEGTIALGEPIDNTQILLLDADLQLVPVGVTGELYIAGEGLARGYVGRPDLTAERFIPNPFSKEPGGRLYRTGDLARHRINGDIEFVGRRDDQVKIRGFRVEIGEVEVTLSQHPSIKESVVVAQEVSPTERRLIAYIVFQGLPKPTPQNLRSFLASKLPDYMVPSGFVVLDSLPLMPNGKVNKSALPAPDSTRQEQETLVAPRNALELQLGHSWEKVLGVRPIGIQDNFFDLGGHSLLALRLFAQIEKMTGKNLPVAALFHAPTIEQLAALIGQQGFSTQWKSLVAIQPGGSRPPLFCLHAHDGGVLFWRDLARHLGSDQPFYALQPKGLDGIESPHTRIEEMAAYYIKEIRTLQPEGPYFLGGHCMGGVIAFEMAQQLHREGEQIALLAFFDSYAPRPGGRARSSFLPRYCHKAIRFFQRTVTLHVRHLLIVASKERLAYLKGKFNKALYKVYMGLGSAWIPAARRRRNILRAASQALRNYHPETYPGKITLFRAAQLGGTIKHDPQMGWGSLAGGELEIHVIPGYHAHIVLEPRVRMLAKQLIASLEKAHQTTKTKATVQEQKRARKNAASILD